jgi:hypothetical protein
MKEEPSNTQLTPSMPDADKLAKLAAQPRFAHLPPEQAAKAALKFWRESQAAIADDNEGRHRLDDARRRYQSIRQPPQWPATLSDFYRLIVRGEDETINQPRFKRFLRYIVEKEQQEIRQQIEKLPECEITGKKTPPLLNALRLQQLETPQAVEGEVDRRFADFKGRRFQPSELPILDPYLPDEWTRLAQDYLEWWEAEKHEAKRRAGRARAAKAAAAKSVAAKSPAPASPEAPPSTQLTPREEKKTCNGPV